jgi:hypothetical protein
MTSFLNLYNIYDKPYQFFKDKDCNLSNALFKDVLAKYVLNSALIFSGHVMLLK